MLEELEDDDELEDDEVSRLEDVTNPVELMFISSPVYVDNEKLDEELDEELLDI